MDFLTCGLINMPLMILNIIANVFFIFCMVFPLHGERIKQPLKILLWSLIYCTMTYMSTGIVLFFSTTTADNVHFILASFVGFACSFNSSMTSSAWLNFFYHTQIVPAKRALFIWIKKNIKPIIYCIWLVERILNLFQVGAVIIEYVSLAYLTPDDSSHNFTLYKDMIYLQIPSSELRIVHAIATLLLKVHFFAGMGVMVMSSGSTVIYLCRHMRRMVANGQPFSCPHLSSQVRVTVTGVLQAVLYVFCAIWTVCYIFPQQNLALSGYSYSHVTVINLYMAGTTLNLGAGQGVFRQRAADIWLRAAQWCKSPKAQESEQGG